MLICKLVDHMFLQKALNAFRIKFNTRRVYTRRDGTDVRQDSDCTHDCQYFYSTSTLNEPEVLMFQLDFKKFNVASC